MGGPSPLGRTRPTEAYDRFPGESGRHRELRLPGATGIPMREPKISLKAFVERQTQERRFGDPGAQTIFQVKLSPSAKPVAQPPTSQNWTWLFLLGLGSLGLHGMEPQAASALGSSMLLGASVFFGQVNPGQAMPLRFLWAQRLQVMFSRGSAKARGLRQLGHIMERAGYLREAHERYEAAVDLALGELEKLQPRDPENRPRAGELQRAAGVAYFSLGAFWERRRDRPSLALENYEMAWKYLNSLGTKTWHDRIQVDALQLRLYSLHLAEAQHWQELGQGLRAGQHYEAAADYARSPGGQRKVLEMASRAYARAEPPRFTEFARVRHKIHSLP